MSNLQIRNVPTDVHRTVKARAVAEGISLSDYLLRLVERDAARPTRGEVLARLRALPARELGSLPADAVRAGRDT
ncbi:MAG: hypothetical protein U0R50_03810 [Gaiellales bacterium]